MVRLVRSLDEIREELRNLSFDFEEEGSGLGEGQTLDELLQAKRWYTYM